MRTESIAFNPSQWLFFCLLSFFCAALFCDPLLLLRAPGFKQIISLISIAVVGWCAGPTRPYHSDFGMLTLGGVPYEASELEEYIAKQENNIGMVVSLLQPFEARGRHLALLRHPIPTQFSFWTTHGISYFHLPMQDLSTEIANQDALELVNAMHRCIEHGNRVYLHCQAGQGRSFIVCMLYLLIYGFPHSKDNHVLIKNYEEALRIVLEKRPQVDATENRRKKIEEVVAVYFEKQLVTNHAAIST